MAQPLLSYSSMGSPLPPLSVEHVRHPRTHRWLDADLLRWAAADGDPQAVSWEDLDAWFVANPHDFRAVSGDQVARVSAMYQRVRDYLAARLVEQLPDAAAPIDRDLLLYGARELIDFAAVARISCSPRPDAAFIEGFRAAFQDGLAQWIAVTHDVEALIALLDTRHPGRLNERAAERLREICSPSIVQILIAALDRTVPLVQQQIIRILGAELVSAAIPALYARAAGRPAPALVQAAARDALLAIAEADPDRIVAAESDPAYLRWLIAQFFDPFRVRPLRAQPMTTIAVSIVAQLDRMIGAMTVPEKFPVRATLLAALGEIPGPAAISVLHGYLADLRYIDAVGDIVRAIEVNYQRWSATGAPPNMVDAWRTQTRSLLDGILFMEYHGGATRRDVLRGRFSCGAQDCALTVQTVMPQRLPIPARVILVAALGRIGAAASRDLLRTIAHQETILAVRQPAIEALQGVGEWPAAMQGGPLQPPIPTGSVIAPPRAPLPKGVIVLPVDPELGRAVPSGVKLRGYLDAWRSHVPQGIRMADYDLVAFFEAPRGAHDEDRPRDMNRAIRDAFQRALRHLAQEQAPVQLHRIVSATVLGAGASWRLFCLLVPKRLLAQHPRTVEARLREWYAAVR